MKIIAATLNVCLLGCVCFLIQERGWPRDDELIFAALMLAAPLTSLFAILNGINLPFRKSPGENDGFPSFPARQTVKDTYFKPRR